MKIAIMQPYVFPYIGYFQMIHAVDVFVFYNDVNFIKGGWVNRNRILFNNEAKYLNIPCKGISSYKPIKEIYINYSLKDYNNILINIKQAYGKAPYFDKVFPMLERLIENRYNTISELAINSCIEISKYLNINTEFKVSSIDYPSSYGLERSTRLFNIIKQLDGDKYINAIGGQDLYNKDAFLNEGIELFFIKSNPIEYKQFNNEFVPWLSIIDVLMFNTVDEIQLMLEKYELIN
jgi:hypothetical protein